MANPYLAESNPYIKSDNPYMESKESLWDRFVKATGAESEMMSSPANAEILRNVVGGGSAWIPAGVIKAAGIVSGQREGADELANLVQEKIVGTPSTEVGKLAQKQIATPFEILSEKSQQAGDLVYDKTGSPLLATATRVAGEAIPFVAPVVVAKGLKGIKGAVKAPEIDLGKVSEKPYSITPDVERVAKAEPPKEVAPEIKAKETPAESVEQNTGVSGVTGGGKQPWEMTDREFTKFYNEYGFKDGWSKYLQEQRKIIEEKHGKAFSDIPEYELTLQDYINAHRSGYTPALGKRGEYHLELAKDDHRAFIEEALENGKSVPESVLKDYPDLLKAQEGVKTEIPKVEPIKPETPIETPLEGKPAKSAVDVNKVIAEKGFEALPDEELAKYNPITKADTISKIDTLLKADESSAIEMAKGNMPIPNDIQAQVLFNTVEKLAEQKGDIQTLMDLAKSPLAEQRSLSAQNLGASAWNKIKDTIVEKIQEVRKARESKITDKKLTENVRKSIKEETQKINLSKEELSWDRFLDKIEC